VHRAGPFEVGHVRPVVGIESRRVLDAFLGDVHREAFVLRVQRESLPGHREQFFAQAEKTVRRHHRIGDRAAAHVHHEFLDDAQVFVLQVMDVVADQGVRAHQFRARSLAVPVLVHTVIVVFLVGHRRLLYSEAQG
jgi:hypothetical protein